MRYPKIGEMIEKPRPVCPVCNGRLRLVKIITEFWKCDNCNATFEAKTDRPL